LPHLSYLGKSKQFDSDGIISPEKDPEDKKDQQSINPEDFTAELPKR
jgi:hypothetical protein